MANGKREMRIHIAITDASGQVFEGDAELSPPEKSHRQDTRKGSGNSTSAPRTPNIDWDLPLRPFLKTYSRGKSGPAKFTLLLAHLAKGRPNVAVMDHRQSRWLEL